MPKTRRENAVEHRLAAARLLRHGLRERVNPSTGTLILPWPNTVAIVRKTVRELRAQGWVAKIEKTDHETYVWSNAPIT